MTDTTKFGSDDAERAARVPLWFAPRDKLAGKRNPWTTVLVVIAAGGLMLGFILQAAGSSLASTGTGLGISAWGNSLANLGTIALLIVFGVQAVVWREKKSGLAPQSTRSGPNLGGTPRLDEQRQDRSVRPPGGPT